MFRKNISNFVVRAGEWDLKTDNEIFSHQDRRVTKVVIHQDYNSTTKYNDVALIFTDKPFDLNKNIQLMCLPEENHNFTNALCFISWWNWLNKIDTIDTTTESGSMSINFINIIYII